MKPMRRFDLKGADGKLIRGDIAEGAGRQVLFITGFLSRRWGSKSKALAQWCAEQGWGFCCYDVRGFGDSEGSFAKYSLSDWLDDARAVISMLPQSPSLTIVGNSLGGWIAWLMAREFDYIDRLILIAPAFNMMGVRARDIPDQRRRDWIRLGSMPWDDDPLHQDWPLSWKWVEESEAVWQTTLDRLRPVSTSIVHGLNDAAIAPEGSRRFVEQLRLNAPSFPVDLHLIPGDHRLSGPEHIELLRRLLVEQR
ncbi:MAG: alpha/beta fold hydrolase [Nitrospira sp.]|nr:alpha/beta fold hydrolase [Nitrospira sp.]